MELVYQFRQGNSFLHKLDPVTKTICLFGISFLAFGTFASIPQVGIALLALSFGIFLGKLSPKEIWRGTGLMFLASVSFFLIQSFMLKPAGEDILFTIGNKVIYKEIVDYALAVSIRIYTIFLVSFIFIRTTHPRDLAVGFIQTFNMPYRIPYAFFIALRIIPMIEDEAKTIKSAHLVRGVGTKPGIKGRIENTKRFTVPLLIRSLRSASVTVQSMESRGFGAYPTRSFVDEVTMNTKGKIISAVFIAAVIVWYTLIIFGVIDMKYSIQ